MPVTFLVLRNAEYAILKWFAEIEQVEGAPGLDLPALDTADVADGYGVSVAAGRGRATSCASALEDAIASDEPELVEVPVAPGMSLVLRSRPMALLAPDVERIAPETTRAGRRPRARRARRRDAASRCASELAGAARAPTAC